MIYQARQDYHRALDAINNSNMSDEEKEAARQEAYSRYWHIVQTEENINKGKKNGSSSSSSGGSFVGTLGGSFSSGSNSSVLGQVEEFIAEGLYSAAKLIPPAIVITKASENLNIIKNESLSNQLLLDSSTNQISIVLCAAWMALSLYGSHLSDENKKIKKFYGKPLDLRLASVGLLQIAALACLGAVFLHSMSEIDKMDKEIKETKDKITLQSNSPINKQKNAILILSATGLAYQIASCCLKHKKIQINQGL